MVNDGIRPLPQGLRKGSRTRFHFRVATGVHCTTFANSATQTCRTTRLSVQQVLTAHRRNGQPFRPAPAGNTGLRSRAEKPVSLIAFPAHQKKPPQAYPLAEGTDSIFVPCLKGLCIPQNVNKQESLIKTKGSLHNGMQNANNELKAKLLVPSNPKDETTSRRKGHS